ncbi:conserved hypothetical protein [Ricinus communis]|uniref:Uncharacterized protein n=1 Tax=Ricinus communis TaxID=3988 RepID=B9S2D3_RICCO|nr:conserved hypothetical protein [Ricinus communis]
MEIIDKILKCTSFITAVKYTGGKSARSQAIGKVAKIGDYFTLELVHFRIPEARDPIRQCSINVSGRTGRGCNWENHMSSRN